MKIHIADSGYEIKADFLSKYTTEIQKAYEDVSSLLPFCSPHINFFVQPREYSLIHETHDYGRTHNSEFVEIAFSPKAAMKDAESILKSARYTVFHEMNHAARWNIPIYHQTFIENCIMEGLATVFAREHAGENALWAQYPGNVKDWLEEIIVLGDDVPWPQYMFRHDDGRKWVGYKVGTYIVDQAIKNSDKTVVELTRLECAEILEFAKISDAKAV